MRPRVRVASSFTVDAGPPRRRLRAEHFAPTAQSWLSTATPAPHSPRYSFTGDVATLVGVEAIQKAIMADGPVEASFTIWCNGRYIYPVYPDGPYIP